MINIIKVDEHYLNLKAPSDVLKYYYDYFKVKDKNCYFNPRFRRKQWDGYFRFIYHNGNFLKGLLVEMIKLAKLNNWKINFDKNLILTDFKFQDSEINLSLKDVDFYEDQFDHIKNIVKYKNGLIKLPTSTGKSYLEIALMNLYKLKGLNNQILIVPRASLVEQIFDDVVTKSNFINPKDVGRLYGGKKEWDKDIIISTWQSLNNILELDPNYGKRFEMLSLDEAHISSNNAKEVRKIIMSFGPKIKYGFSATVLSKESNALEFYTSTSLFGSIISTDNVKNLQESGRIAKSEINIKLLKYPIQKEIRSYQDYEKFIKESPLRRKYIKKLIKEIQIDDPIGNILILIRNVDFIKEFYEDLQQTGFDVSLIHGSVSIDDRIKIKKEIEEGKNKILLASDGTFTLGESVKNLNSLIMVQNRKSEIENIQKIGRLLRISPDKEKARIFDIVDDLVVVVEKDDGKIVKKHFGRRHLKARIKALKLHKFEINNIEIINL